MKLSLVIVKSRVKIKCFQISSKSIVRPKNNMSICRKRIVKQQEQQDEKLSDRIQFYKMGQLTDESGLIEGNE